MNSPLVSVILCNYNYERYVGEAIESVLGQTYPHFELILVDDGSTDKSREIIAYYGKVDPERVIPIFKDNGGQASAFNAGFERANGEIISFLDSDDFWSAEKLEDVVKAYSEHEYSVVQHNHYVINAESRISTRVHPGIFISGDLFRRYFVENHTEFFSSTSGISCLKKHLEKLFPLDESWRICADVPLTRPLPLFGEVLTLETHLGYYRIHGHNTWMNSLSQSRFIENRERYAEYLNSKLAEYGMQRKIEFKKSIPYKSWRFKHSGSGLGTRLLYCADIGLAKAALKVRLMLL